MSQTRLVEILSTFDEKLRRYATNLFRPATSQVGLPQGKYVARCRHKSARNNPVEPFQYHHLGMLAYIGIYTALADLQSFKGRGWSTRAQQIFQEL